MAVIRDRIISSHTALVHLGPYEILAPARKGAGENITARNNVASRAKERPIGLTNVSGARIKPLLRQGL